MEINTEIEKTLNSLNKLQKAEMHPFLYEKIKHRMQTEKYETTKSVVFSWKMAFGLSLVISINVLACWNYKTEVQNSNTSASNTNTDSYYYNTAYNY